MELQNNYILSDKKQSKINFADFMQGAKDCIPTIFGYLSIGFTCGVVSKSCGLTFWETTGMSTFIYAGSSQFIAASMILSALSAPSIIFTIFLVNLRHLFMSAALAPYFQKNSFWQNFSIGTLLTDETFVVASSMGIKKSHLSYAWMTGLNLTAYLNWILATGIGVLFGSLIPNYEVFGLDFALTAMFIGLLASSIKDNIVLSKSLFIIFSTIIILVGSTYFVSTNTSVLIAALIGALIGMVIKK
ncbi:MAG: branched-chain amino acid permease [Firmicutes bacterium]|nr:branched-chain amino acid permease [Bacillota bacterium]